MKRCMVILGLGVFSAVAVLAYNLWAYCCGRCTLRGFLIIGPFEKAMIGLTLLTALALVTVKVFRRRQMAGHRCQCGVLLYESWIFCPECGAPRR